jgi:hypothetical protein
MIHDFCGGLEEELMRTNFILVYELIDEMIVSVDALMISIGLWASISNVS